MFFFVSRVDNAIFLLDSSVASNVMFLFILPSLNFMFFLPFPLLTMLSFVDMFVDSNVAFFLSFMDSVVNNIIIINLFVPRLLCFCSYSRC